MTPASRLEAVILGNLALVVALAVISLVRDPSGAFAPGAPDLARMLYLGVVQVGLAYVIYGYGIARVPALEASLVNMIEPVLNPLWVFLVLGEKPGWWAVLGGAIILGAVGTRTLIVERRSRHGRVPGLPAEAGP
jgi:drug/metabolite transporter (DMT)-like permease